VNFDVMVRDASIDDAEALAVIGRRAMPLQYRGLVDPVAVNAAVEQIYSDAAIGACIRCCDAAPDAWFLVAERRGAVRVPPLRQLRGRGRAAPAPCG
jgi:hypothetical protein